MAYVSSEKTIYTCNGSSLAVDLLAEASQVDDNDEKEIFSIINLERDLSSVVTAVYNGNWHRR